MKNVFFHYFRSDRWEEIQKTSTPNLSATPTTPPSLAMLGMFESHVAETTAASARGKERCAKGIISPMSGKILGSSIHDVDLLEGGCDKTVTDPALLRYGANRSTVSHSAHVTSCTLCFPLKNRITDSRQRGRSATFARTARRSGEGVYNAPR